MTELPLQALVESAVCTCLSRVYLVFIVLNMTWCCSLHHLTSLSFLHHALHFCKCRRWAVALGLQWLAVSTVATRPKGSWLESAGNQGLFCFSRLRWGETGKQKDGWRCCYCKEEWWRFWTSVGPFFRILGAQTAVSPVQVRLCDFDLQTSAFSSKLLSSRDICPILKDPSALTAVIDMFEEHVRKNHQHVDLIAGIGKWAETPVVKRRRRSSELHPAEIAPSAPSC